MRDWLTDHITFLLTQEDKLSDILATLTFFQCVGFVCLFLLALNVSDLGTKIRKIEREK